jgi:ssDNA-binding Zn-finger/Zn-ribbon topoisomerase 1
MVKRAKKKKVCPKCHEPIYLVGTSVDESYRILTCRNKDCEYYMRILKDKAAIHSQSKDEDAGSL